MKKKNRKVLLDARLGYKNTGIGKYIKSLVEFYSTSPECMELYVLVNKETNIEFPKNVKVIASKLRPYNMLHFLVYPFFLLKLKTLTKFEILHSSTYSGAWYRAGFKQVCTVHDLMYRKIEKYFTTNTLLNWFAVLYYDFITKRTLSSSEKIVAISNSTKTDIFELVKKCDVSVLPHFVEQKNDIGTSNNRELEEYLLYVGNTRPQKNLSTLINAFNRSNKRVFKRLVIVTRDEIDVAGKDILVLNDVEDTELPLLYKNARASILPSLYEGFGYPVIESLLMATPVICSNEGSLKEFSKDYCVFFNPRSELELEQLLNLYELPKFDSERLKCYLEGFSKNRNFESLTEIIFHNLSSNENKG